MRSRALSGPHGMLFVEALQPLLPALPTPKPTSEDVSPATPPADRPIGAALGGLLA